MPKEIDLFFNFYSSEMFLLLCCSVSTQYHIKNSGEIQPCPKRAHVPTGRAYIMQRWPQEPSFLSISFCSASRLVASFSCSAWKHSVPVCRNVMLSLKLYCESLLLHVDFAMGKVQQPWWAHIWNLIPCTSLCISSTDCLTWQMWRLKHFLKVCRTKDTELQLHD